MKQLIEMKDMLLMDAAGILGFTTTPVPENYVEISMENLVFTRLFSDGISDLSPKGLTSLEDSYFSAKGCPCSYPFDSLQPIIHLCSTGQFSFKILLPTKLSPAWIILTSERYGGKDLYYVIAPRCISIYGDLLE